MRRRAQRELFAVGPRSTAGAIGAEEKTATRARQDGRCADCGGTSRGGQGLDVVRRNGQLVGLCRSHRLRFDAPTRCAKAVQKRRRPRARPRPAGQLRLGDTS